MLPKSAPRKRTIAITGAAFCGLLLSAWIMLAAEENKELPRLRPFYPAARKVHSLHRTKTEPQPGDWLAEHDEPGQTFSQYRNSRPNRPTRVRTTIYLQPIGDFTAEQEKIVAATAEMLEPFYFTPVRKLKPIPLDAIPDRARRTHPTWGDRQLLTSYILYDLLKPRRPKDAVAVLALTASDLWPGEGWNFVYGQAALRDRVGVWSLYRNGDASESDEAFQRALRRSLQTATHETGHMLGIKHCTLYECGMNGSNHQSEADSRPLALCPECAQKVWWACDADPAERYESLAKFANANGLDEDALLWKRSLERLRE